MLWSKISSMVFVLVITLVTLSSSASEVAGSDMLTPYGPLLVKNGYELTEAGLRKVFQNNNEQEKHLKMDCVCYIREKEMAGLLPEVKSYLAEIEQSVSAIEPPKDNKMIVMGCILALDKNMDQKTLDRYLTQIRKRLFESSSEDPMPIQAYEALLDAQKGQGVNIREDLEFLCMTDILKPAEDQIRDLFELYGKDLRDSDIDELLKARKDNPELQELILHHAKQHGLKLNTPTPKAP